MSQLVKPCGDDVPVWVLQAPPNPQASAVPDFGATGMRLNAHHYVQTDIVARKGSRAPRYCTVRPNLRAVREHKHVSVAS